MVGVSEKRTGDSRRALLGIHSLSLSFSHHPLWAFVLPASTHSRGSYAEADRTIGKLVVGLLCRDCGAR